MGKILFAKRIIAGIGIALFSIFPAMAQRQMENINRGLVAVQVGPDTVYIGWRLLGSDPQNVAFNLYRTIGSAKATKINKYPLVKSTNFVDAGIDATRELTYYVRPVSKNKELKASEPVKIWIQNYLSIPLQTPEGYRPGDASVGDLDGDGEYEIVLHQTGRGMDNSQAGMTSAPILEAYKLNGSLMWRINLGKNIREGAHYTQFMVYDLDGDGKSEVVCKTADGTIDGVGNIIGNADSLYVIAENTRVKFTDRRGSERERRLDGFIISGPEYLTVFDGQTGAAMATADYVVPRCPGTLYPSSEQLNEIWGDGYGNRVDRFLACIAYLDGETPSVVMCRGYYTRSVLAAWNYRDGKLTHLWTFDSEDGTPENKAFSGQGNHNLSVGDVDNDGKDEIVYGACVIDDNGKGLYSTGFGHGDAMHFSDLDPGNPGLEVFNIQERFDDAGMNFREAGTGKVLWKVASVKADESGGDAGEGPGRGNAFDIDPRYKGAECWVRGAGIEGLYSAKGERISDVKPGPCNFAVWWDGDLLRELLDYNFVAKWNWETNSLDTLLLAKECASNNGTKATPALSADLLGDWREEIIWRTNNNKELRIYTTTIPTNFRLYTLMHDPVYRLGIAWQNVAYNQPPHVGFYLGEGMGKAP
jgi:rhamnogalacturonan endolyase